jgi:hypothetical protein
MADSVRLLEITDDGGVDEGRASWGVGTSNIGGAANIRSRSVRFGINKIMAHTSPGVNP